MVGFACIATGFDAIDNALRFPPGQSNDKALDWALPPWLISIKAGQISIPLATDEANATRFE